MSLIRKYAAPLAVLSALAMAAACPYLIPENPDSAVFRSGTLGLILLCAGAVPVYKALLSADRRTLLCSGALGFLFALALSLGSELFVYDGLLRGTHSLLRRMAVPVLSAPYLGALCCGAMQFVPRARRRLRIPTWGYALVIFACWLPLLWAYWPGMLNYDFLGEYTQHLEGSYTNLHPLLHSAVMNGLIALGETLHSRTFGVLLYSLVQMGCFALSLGHSCAFAQRRGVPAVGLIGMAALYALHPIFSVMALSVTKDTLFAAAILTLSLLTWEMIENPEPFLKNKRCCALYVFCSVNAALMRNNGMFALALLLPGVIVALRSFRKQAACLSAVCTVAALVTTGLLTLALSPAKMPSFQLYSLPAQQLVRAAASGNMQEEDVVELRSWYVADEGMVVHPHLADPAKGYLDMQRMETESDRFLALWKKHLPAHVHEYLEAFLMLNVGSWYPDDLSHSTIYPDVTWSDKGYLQTQELDMTAQGIKTFCFLPAVREFYESVCRANAYQAYPVVSVFFGPATPFWVLMFAGAILVARRQTRCLPALLGCMGLWLSYLFGPCTLPRYALPLFCLAPAALAAALSLPARAQAPGNLHR